MNIDLIFLLLFGRESFYFYIKTYNDFLSCLLVATQTLPHFALTALPVIAELLNNLPPPPPPPPEPRYCGSTTIKHQMNSTRTAPDGGSGIGSNKKKAAGIRAWLSINNTGETQVVEMGRQSTIRRTGLTARDLRIIDPLLSYPSTIFGRERAFLVNLEHIKAIIATNEVLLLNSEDPYVLKFVEDLKIRIVRFHSATTTIQEGSLSINETESRNLICNSDNENLMSSRIDQSPTKYSSGFQNEQTVLPFEFIVLEACLEAACSSLGDQATTLDQDAYPVLDKLASKTSTLNLERVLKVKTRLVILHGRVQKVKDELENLLNDDEDMAEMYLTHKAMKKHLDGSSVSSRSENNDNLEDEILRTEMDDDSTTEYALAENDISNDSEGEIQSINPRYHLLTAQNTLRGDRNGAISKQRDLKELEMLLEAYFVQIDGTLNKLSTLKEYIDDTEDYINIMLDDKQNQLLKFDVMLATGSLVLNVFVCMFSTLALEIKIELFQDVNESSKPEFWWVVGAGVAGSIIIYVLAIAWWKHKGLL